MVDQKIKINLKLKVYEIRLHGGILLNAMEILRTDEIFAITGNKIKNRPYWETNMEMINFIKL